MRTTSPRQLAFLTSIIITALAIILMVIMLHFNNPIRWYMLAGIFLVIFVSAFLLIFFTVNNFIFDKINPIYKTIENIPLTKGELKKKLEGKDMIQEVNRLVINYAQNRTKEIKKLRRLEKYRKEFLGNVSHELKTPIFNIQGYILTLLDGGLEDQEINREYLERTERSVNRMITIIEDLESIARLETGELKLEWEDFDIVQVIRDVFDMQEMNASKYGIPLVYDKSYDKSVKVHADKKRITEVLNNLIINSIYYGNQGGTTTINIEEMGENILVDVTDTGIGISEEDIPRIFERFYRTDKSRSRDRGGTGLGLSIVKHIIEAHNQTITARSELGVGTSFSFTLKKA
jgi:two-component system phosphate regulon sensor histidine kinase PhoR